MNKWVVLILMALAFTAGGLSFYKMGQRASGPAGSTPVPKPSVLATGSATPVAAPTAMVRATGAPPRDPNFGTPPKPGTARTPGGNPFGPDKKKPRVVMGEIRAHVFSTAADGPALTRFPKKIANVYMTLSPVGMRDDVELVASIRSAMVEGEAFSEPVQSSGPPRLRTFRFSTPAGGWVSGPYQVAVKPAGSEQVLILSRFEIEKEDAPAAQVFEAPEYLNLIKDTTTQEPSSVFSEADPQIALQVDSLKVPSSVKIRSVWSAVEVEKLTPGELFAVAETLPPGGEQDALFKFDPPKGGFLPGSYRVDVYFDQQKVGSQAFFIQPADQTAATTATATAAPTSTP